MIETIKTLGALASSVLGIISCLVLVIKPIRTKFVNWIKKTSNASQTDQLLKELKELKTMIEENNENARLQGEASLCLLRKDITQLYYKYPKEIPIYERESLVKMYKSYHALNGNSYVDIIYEEMMKLPVVK
jgi:hypothetical protein